MPGNKKFDALMKTFTKETVAVIHAPMEGETGGPKTVAMVEVDKTLSDRMKMEEAFKLTNSINDAWWNNEEVTPMFPDATCGVPVSVTWCWLETESMNSLELKNWFGRKFRMVEYNMVYPTNRWVSEDFIRMKYSDAVANSEVEYTDLTDIDEIIDELMDTGQVTFTTKTRELLNA